MLIGQFWGTSAAEGIPAPFCRCAVCTKARKERGKYERKRSSFRLSDSTILDLGADAVTQTFLYGDLVDLNHVLVTHTHDDHLNPHMMMEAFWGARCGYRNTPLHYYFTEQAYEIVEQWRQNYWILKGMVPGWEKENFIEFHKLHYGERVEIDGIGVTPFKGFHVGNMRETSALYLLELPDGRNLFYGLDSGRYFPETVEALKNYRIDLFISECTGGIQPSAPESTHMNLENVRRLVDVLLAQGTLHQNSILYLTHINHGTGHDEMEDGVRRLQFPIETHVAYDGLKIL